MPSYTYTELEDAMQDLAHGNLKALKKKRAIINRSVREVNSRVDLRGTKRKSALSPSLFRQVYQYTKPTDLKGIALIDLKPQIDRVAGYGGEWILTTPENFDRYKRSYRNVMAVQDTDFNGRLLISGVVDSKKTTLHELDSLTDDGTVSTDSDTPANNVTLDKNDYVNGSASANFDVDTSGTDPAVDIAGATATDLTDFEGQQIFVWVYLANASISNIQLRWGSSVTAYYQRQITTNNEGLAFVVGWNLLRFDWDSSVTTAGAPTITAIDTYKLIINLSAALATQVTDWRIDFIVARRGVIHDVIYYSKYLWQNSGGTYIEDSTADTDVLNADTDEIDLIAARVDYNIAKALKNRSDIKQYKADYIEAEDNYKLKYPSEALSLSTTYYDFDSLADNVDVGEVLDRDTT